jgi:hypothetical protein
MICRLSGKEQRQRPRLLLHSLHFLHGQLTLMQLLQLRRLHHLRKLP